MGKKRFASITISVILIFSLLTGCAGSVADVRDNDPGNLGGSADTGGNGSVNSGADSSGNPGSLGNGWQPESSMELLYAENFSVDYYNGGYALITISNGSRYLVVPQGREAPAGIDADITVLKQPIDKIYLVATSAMCLFDALDALDNISLSGTKAKDWYIGNAKTAMEAGNILYAGKYSAPDYELIMSNGCNLAIESTMISHTPEVKEKLEDVGIPVLVDQSSYETHPLGRTEWIKLYAALLGKEDIAKRIFDEQAGYVDSVAGQGNTGKTVAFFYISSAGYAVARKSGDYVTKMIELAGGNYIFKNLGDPKSATSTVKLEMEEFYATAKEADFIIYNSTIDGELSSVEELVAKNSLLKDFKAVQNGNVWCTNKNLFQETTQLGLMISDIHRMLTEGDGSNGSGGGLTKLNFMYKLQ
jgi:iron complex transport system substrate-binding protein